MNRRITSQPKTAMELAYNKAVQQFANKAHKKLNVPTSHPPGTNDGDRRAQVAHDDRARD